MNLLVAFMVWVIISALIPFIHQDLNLAPQEITIITAIPVVLGSVLRIPIGYITERVGARVVYVVSFLILLLPVYYISMASTTTDLFIGGFFLGLGGALFSVGVTSLPKYYPKHRHGLVNGIYGMGNIGSAITIFFAPLVATNIGWYNTVKVYIILLMLFIVLNFFYGDRKERIAQTSFVEQLKAVYQNEKLWIFSLFYFITFGSFLVFSINLPISLVSYFGLNKADAGMRTAVFILLSTLARPVGGWLADRLNAYILLIGIFISYVLAALVLAFLPTIVFFSIACLTIALSSGLGNGILFKLVAQYFCNQRGIANGIVSMMGGLGGFFPPVVLSILYSLTGNTTIGFILLSQLAVVCIVLASWLYRQEVYSNERAVG